MKLLHLSDLHIGKNVNGFPMLEEQRHVFAQIVGAVTAETIEAVVIAGDVYDRSLPGTDAVSLFDDFLTQLVETGVAVLLVAGNHDSPERLAYARRLLAEKRVFLAGTPEVPLRPITLRDDHGDIHFWLLPFVRPASVRHLFAERSIDTHHDAVAAVLEATPIDPAQRNVLVAHQFFTSPHVSPVQSESETNVGGLDRVDASLVASFDYVALGHLHRAQSVGQPSVRYAGSPIKYSFSESAHSKTTTLVTLGNKDDVEIATLPLTPLHDLRHIQGPLADLVSNEIASQGNRDDYLRVTLTDDNELIEPLAKLRSVYPNVMLVDFDNARTRADTTSPAFIAAIPAHARIEQLNTFDLFSDFFRTVYGKEMSGEQVHLVRELLDTPDTMEGAL